VAVLTLRYSGIHHHVSIASLQEQKEHLLVAVEHNYLKSVGIFIILYALIAVFALPLPALFTLVGGYLFGTIPGTLYSNVGAVTGSTIFFLMIRHSLGASIQKKYKDKLGKINKRIKKYGISYLIALRMLFIIPFFVQNTLVGLTNVSTFTFFWTTAVGILPTSFVFSYAGQQLAEIDSIKDVFSGDVLIAFILLAILGFIPILIQRYQDYR
jgi:uncharacterized membrane protein YdjX (TVP38/TMEM64 family)